MKQGDFPHIHPPWDDRTVAELNAFQTFPHFHPFTCPESPHGDLPKPSLVATTDGWVCPGCDYTQGWAHTFMADPEIRRDPLEGHR
jgi:hypothetical protein